MSPAEIYVPKSDGIHRLTNWSEITPYGDPPATGLFGDPGIGKVYYGLNTAGIETFNRETQLGHHAAVRRSYWNDSSGSTTSAVNTVTSDLATGRVPWISFKLQSLASQPGWRSFANGSGDAWFANLLTRLNAIGKGPILLTLHHEPNGDENTGNTPTDHINMYLHAKTMTDAYPRILLVPCLATSQYYTTAASGPHLQFSAWMTAASCDMPGYDIYNPDDYPDSPSSHSYLTWATNIAGTQSQLNAIFGSDMPHAIGEWGLHTWTPDPSKTLKYMDDMYTWSLTYAYCTAYFDAAGSLDTILDQSGSSHGVDDNETGPPWVRLNKWLEQADRSTSAYITPGGLT